MRRELCLALLLPFASAQSLTDAAAIRAALARVPADAEWLACQVEPIPPVLDFGLRLQAGYIFRFPLSLFSGSSGANLTVMTTITPEGSGLPVHLIDRVRVPPVPETGMDGEVGGSFFLGQGRYRVNWLLFDNTGRKCRKEWEVNAQLSGAGRGVKLVMPPNTVAELSLRASSATDHHPDAVPPKRLTILLDAAPLSAGSAAATMLNSSDQVFLLGALSALLERVPVSSARLVVFNLEQQKELFRRDGFALESIDEVAGILNQLQLATVSYQAVRNRQGHIDLLAGLMNRELNAEPPSDVVIFVGPRERYHDKLPRSRLVAARGAAPRFLFLVYQPPRSPNSVARAGGADITSAGQVNENLASDQKDPFGGLIPGPPERLPDTLSRAIAELKGKTIVIESPRQFSKAIEQIERRGR